MPLRLGRGALRLGAAALALTASVGTAIAGPADTRAEISDAQRRLRALEARISSQQSRVLTLTGSLRTMAAEVARGRRALEALEGRLTRTSAQRLRAQERYRELRGRIERAAAAAYVRGPAYAIEAILGARSLREASDVLAYTGAIATRHAEMAEEVSRLAFELASRERQEAALAAQRRSALERLSAQQDALVERFAEQQALLAEMQASRAELAGLLARLRARLRAEELAAAERALANGTPLTFGRWAEELLSFLGAPVARNNLVVVVAWQVAEYTTARWNPLATTYPMPGSTRFNDAGVRNYVSLRQGLEATRRTLARCCYGYEAILANLAHNADPMTSAEAINRSRWCRGCADGGYVVDLIPTVERYYDRYANDRA